MEYSKECMTDFQELLANYNGNWTSYTNYPEHQGPDILCIDHLLRDHDRAYFKGTVSQDGNYTKVHKSMHCGTLYM
jgi:hypothetical protein